MKILSVFDTKGNSHYPPQIAKTTEEGRRQFAMTCENKETMLHKFPADFILKEIGEWDEVEGYLIPYEKPVILNTASDFVD
jgi:hypothetical protein